MFYYDDLSMRKYANTEPNPNHGYSLFQKYDQAYLILVFFLIFIYLLVVNKFKPCAKNCKKFNVFNVFDLKTKKNITIDQKLGNFWDCLSC